jgi:hypothetical protein
VTNYTLTEALLGMWDCMDPVDARDLRDIVDHNIPHPFI